MSVSFSSFHGKLIIFLLITLAVSSSFLLYLFFETNRIKNESEQIETLQLPLVSTIRRLSDNLTEQAYALQRNIALRDTMGMHQMEQRWKHDIEPDLDLLTSHKESFTNGHQTVIEELPALFQRYHMGLREGQRLVRVNPPIPTPVLGDSAFFAMPDTNSLLEPRRVLDSVEDVLEQIKDHLATLRDSNLALIEGNAASIHRQTATFSWLIPSLIVMVILLVVISGYKILSTLRKSIKRPEEILSRLGEGDTSVHIQATGDEMDRIIQASNKLGTNLQQASDFARQIGEGIFDSDFKPVSDNDVLGNSLVQMRDKLRSITEADRRRNWLTEGLTKFADLMRRNDDYEELSNALVSGLVKYVSANQGGLFILNRDNESDLHLQLLACYAFDRRKFTEKRIELGQGLIGQCFLEGNTIRLEEVPKNYVTITSGLGNATPTSVLIVPLKVNDVIEGILELASFRKFDQHEIEFVEKVGEIVASTLANARINDRTKKLLADSQQQSEEMRAQEEEMRQNMEEMQATQEQMHRQTQELKRIQENLEMEKSMFNVLMEFLPDRITYKDANSRILRINQAKATRLNMTPEEVIGKTDYDFFAKEHAEKAMQEEQKLIRSGRPLLDIEERLTFQNGDIAWVSTSRIPFKNDHGEVSGMFIITKDVTKLKLAEMSLKDQEEVIRRLLENLPVFGYKINQDGLIHDIHKPDAPDFPDVSFLKGKSVKEYMPEIHELIQSESPDQNGCISTLKLNGEEVSFKHYVFQDHFHKAAFWGYAVRQLM